MKERTILNLRTNHRVEPLAVDDPHPSFSWQMSAARRGACQKAYRVMVQSGNSITWDSGRVEESRSVGIRYPETAVPLQPETDYTWQVTVWDELGEALEASSRFSTGFMGQTLAAWHGAEWIGPDEIAFAAETLPVFRMKFRMQITQGGKSAGIVFGVSDPRLNSSTKNNYLIHGENYIAYRLDVSELPARVMVSRKGYARGEQEEKVIETMKVPLEVIHAENRFEEHAFEIVVSGNQMEVMTIDGVPLETGEDPRLVSTNMRQVTEHTHLILNPLRQVLDVPVYPRLCQAGFTTDEQTTAVFSDYAIHHYGGEQAQIFGAETGATYAIFAGLPGVALQGDQMLVSPGTLAYADPSYGSQPMLRREFSLEGEVASARLYVAARGIYEMRINGQKVGEEYLANGDMDFCSRIFYTAYEVTSLLQAGQNALGATLASGWYQDQLFYALEFQNWYGDREGLLALMVVTYRDGRKAYLPSDGSWQYFGQGPVRYAGNFNGEIYDATREKNVEGWDHPGFSAEGWRGACRMESRVRGREPLLQAKPDPGIFHTETLSASYVGTETRGEDQDTVYLYDMGINMVGIPEITFPQGEADRQVTIRYAEILYPRLPAENPYCYGDLAGMILTENLRGALATDRYTMKGEKDEVFCPVYTFHGYRYVEISGLSAPLPAENIRGIVLSSVHETAHYESSHPLANQLFTNCLRSTMGNHLSIPTDCPQRDERLGWAGDAQVFSETATYLADMSAFYGFYNLLQRDAQGRDGTFHLYAPPYMEAGEAFALGYTWNAAGVVIPWQTFLQYGDQKTLEENYPSVRRHIEGMMTEKAPGKQYLTSHIGFLGDHLSLQDTDCMLMDNAQFYRSVRIAERMARLLGIDADAQRFQEYGDGLQTEWNLTFVNDEGQTRAADGTIQDTQASYALPLMCEVFTEENRARANQRLQAACERTGYTMTTGFMGTGPLLPALTRGGEAETAYRLFEQTNYPSWFYPVLNGATSVWERWNSYTIENGFGGQNGMNSFNHYSLGAVASWMIEYQAGIQREDVSGFQSFLLQPMPGGSFTWLKASYDSIYGTIHSEWTAEQGKLRSYRAVVPANTTATLYLPISKEAAARIPALEGACFLGRREHHGQEKAIFALQAGTYEFQL